jgi:hypothetical protein
MAALALILRSTIHTGAKSKSPKGRDRLGRAGVPVRSFEAHGDVEVYSLHGG